MTEFTKNFPPKRTFITAELFEEKNSLTQIIKNDKTLSLMHKEDMFKIEIDEEILSPLTNILRTYYRFKAMFKLPFRLGFLYEPAQRDQKVLS